MKIKQLLLCISIIALNQPVMAENPQRAQAIIKPIVTKPYLPPTEDTIPQDEFGDMVRLGKQVFTETGKYAPKYVGNKLNCVNCHLDAGRKAGHGSGRFGVIIASLRLGLRASVAPSPPGSTRSCRLPSCPDSLRRPCRIPGRQALRGRRP